MNGKGEWVLFFMTNNLFFAKTIKASLLKIIVYRRDNVKDC